MVKILERNQSSLNYSTEKFDQFPESREGYETVGSEPGSPSDEIERPPLRHIDKYMKPQFFGLTARYTVSIMAMIGFIISFGMKNNVSTAKIAKKSLTGVGSHVSLLLIEFKTEIYFLFFIVVKIELDGR